MTLPLKCVKAATLKISRPGFEFWKNWKGKRVRKQGRIERDSPRNKNKSKKEKGGRTGLPRETAATTSRETIKG